MVDPDAVVDRIAAIEGVTVIDEEVLYAEPGQVELGLELVAVDVERDTVDRVHCSRCGAWGDADAETCASCGNDVTEAPVVARPR